MRLFEDDEAEACSYLFSWHVGAFLFHHEIYKLEIPIEVINRLVVRGLVKQHEMGWLWLGKIRSGFPEGYFKRG